MFDLSKVLHAGRTAADLLVQDGDLIYVPDSAVDWDLVLRAVSGAAMLSWLF